MNFTTKLLIYPLLLEKNETFVNEIKDKILYKSTLTGKNGEYTIQWFKIFEENFLKKVKLFVEEQKIIIKFINSQNFNSKYKGFCGTFYILLKNALKSIKEDYVKKIEVFGNEYTITL